MPPRGKTPGLKIGRTLRDGTRLTYWIARQVARDIRDFPDPCIRLPGGLSDDELVALCESHTRRLRAHLAAADDGSEPQVTPTRYDGTVLAACRIYQEHPLSPFRGVKHNTRRTYLRDLGLIERSVGRRLIRNVTVLDVQHWYNEWRKPAAGDTAERITRAHHAVATFRSVIYFNAALRRADCKVLASELERVRFEKAGAREEELTYQHATAFIRMALEFGRKGLMPADRTLNLAIGTAAQFELALRQMDVIGEWAKLTATRRIPAGASTLIVAEEMWAGFFVWENIAGWRWRMRTSKSKYRAAADFDLTRYELLMPLLEAVPLHKRTGAIVKGEKDLPVRQAMYGRWWRRIARAAGIPDAVWNMDARAGAATEADEAGAEIGAIQGALTHESPGTTLRYIRNRKKKIAAVADARAAHRKASEGGGDAGT